ncbi:MAG: hypothetical protein ACRD9R_17075 [Pyrinomonadaceae bacterium]
MLQIFTYARALLTGAQSAALWRGLTITLLLFFAAPAREKESQEIAVTPETQKASRPRRVAPVVTANQAVAAAADDANSVSDSDQTPFEPVTDSATILRAARSIYVRQQSIYFKPEELENVLRRRPEFRQWELLLTRDETSADLVIEVRRKAFTTKFVFTVLDPRTQTVVASGRVSSLFGDLESKIVSSFVKQLRRVRPLPAAP